MTTKWINENGDIFVNNNPNVDNVLIRNGYKPVEEKETTKEEVKETKKGK